MAFYENIEIPAVSKRVKTVPRNFMFEGTEMDYGQGTIIVATIGRLVDAENNPLVDAQGKFIYEPGDRQHVQVALPTVMSTTINGITGMDVLNWLGVWFDQQVTPVEPPEVIPE